MYYPVIKQCVDSLKRVDGWLDKAQAHATAKKFDIDVLLYARLAPDQYHFIQQIQGACDYTKGAVAWLSGEPLPKHPDTETTLADIRERVRKTVAFAESVDESRYATADERKVTLSWARGNPITAPQYLLEIVVPDVYFHLTTAYSILRHNGVELGKIDFVGPLYARR